MQQFIQDLKIGYHSFRREWNKRKCFAIQDKTGFYHHDLICFNQSYKSAYKAFTEAREALRPLIGETTH